MKYDKIDIDELLEEYKIDTSIFTNADDRLLEIADKYNQLTDSERILLVLYAELQSYRKVGKVIGFSHSSVQRFLKSVREKLCS